jgi:iron complex outermembrane receptor protein
MNRTPIFLVLVISGLPNIYAQPADSSITIDAVQVEAYQSTGYLLTIPGSLSVLTGDAIGLTDGTNLAGTLNSLPGVTMQSGTYTTNRIVVRGMGSRTPYNTNRIRFYLNDIPLTTADGISTPEEMDLLNLGRMELIKGPSSALYGSGLGGSINMYSPVNVHNGGKLTLQMGSYRTGRANLSGAFHRGKTSLQAGLGHLESAGYRDNNHYKRTTFLSGATWKHDGWSVDLTLLLMGVNGSIPSSLGKTMFENEPQSAAPNWKAVEGYKKYSKIVTGITVNNRLSERITNKLVLFGRGNDSYERRPFNNLDDRSLSIGLRNKLSFQTRKSEWVFGTEWIAEQYDWALDKDSVLLNKNREDRRLLNLFAIFNYRPNPKLNISLAMALNHISYLLTDEFMSNGDQSGSRHFPLIVSPRIGFNYSPVNRWAVYASAGHGYSSPSPEESLLPEGDVNPEIKPEQGIQFEIGTRLHILHNTLNLDASFYHIEVKDLLLTKRITEDIFTGINAGRTRHQGLELQLQSRFFAYSNFPGKLVSVISYAHSLNHFIDFTDDGITYDGNQLPGIPDQTVYLQFTWDPFKVLEIFADMYYAGDQYLNDMNDASYPGYFVSNVKVSSEFPLKKAGTISLFAGINNFTDTHYASMLVINATASGGSEPRYYYPGLPRHGYLGITFNF